MSRLLFTWFISIGLTSCKHDSGQQEKPDRISSESMAILQTVIRNDSLALSSHNPRARPILAQVEPLHFLNYRIDSGSGIERIPLPPGFFGVRDLLDLEHNNLPFFTQNDTLFLIQQGLNKQKGLLDSTLIPAHDLTYTLTQSGDKQVYVLSLPLFSQDSLRAYMQVNQYCRPMCSYGKDFLLEKKDGQWHVVEKEDTWIE